MTQIITAEILKLSRRDGWWAGDVRFCGADRTMEFFVSPSGREIRLYPGGFGVGNNRTTASHREALLAALKFRPEQPVRVRAAPDRPGPRRMAAIARAVAEERRVSVGEMKSASCERRVAWPRQEAMARMMEAGFSSAQAAGYFNRTNHTTALHAKKAVAARQLEADVLGVAA